MCPACNIPKDSLSYRACFVGLIEVWGRGASVTSKAMPRAERKRQFAAMGRQLKSQGDMHAALVAKFSGADDSTKLRGPMMGQCEQSHSLCQYVSLERLRFDMLREWMLHDGDLGAIYVEEKLPG